MNADAVEAKGCREAMARVVAALQPRLVELVRSSSIHRNDRADAVQEVLIQVIKCVQGYDPARGDFVNYAVHSAKLVLYRTHAKNGKTHGREVCVEDLEVEARPESTEQVTTVDDSSGIPVMHREVVGDYYGIGRPRSYSINQIAARRGMSNAAVRDALREAVSAAKGKVIV